MLLLALAIAPGIAICLFIYSKDRYDKEPLRYLLFSFLLGMASTFPALVVQLLAGDPREKISSHFFWWYALFAYVIVACSEEGSKFLMLRWYAYPKKSFNDPFDGIVYSVMVAMGRDPAPSPPLSPARDGRVLGMVREGDHWAGPGEPPAHTPGGRVWDKGS